MSNENPTAFPVNDANLGGPGAYSPEPGMFLRDYFAAKAMAAELNMWHHPSTDVDLVESEIAGRAYRMADAMLAARKEQP